jgi:5-methylcytosine-specific restriction protein A
LLRRLNRTNQWEKARAAYLAEHPLCVMCKADGRLTGATVVYHIKPHKGDPELFWNPANWQAVCKPHHDRDKQRAERGRPAQRLDADGWPMSENP